MQAPKNALLAATLHIPGEDVVQVLFGKFCEAVDFAYRGWGAVLHFEPWEKARYVEGDFFIAAGFYGVNPAA